MLRLRECASLMILFVGPLVALHVSSRSGWLVGSCELTSTLCYLHEGRVAKTFTNAARNELQEPFLVTVALAVCGCAWL